MTLSPWLKTLLVWAALALFLLAAGVAFGLWFPTGNAVGLGFLAGACFSAAHLP